MKRIPSGRHGYLPDPSETSVELLAMQMWRHRSPAGVKLAIKMSELAARVFEKESSAQSEEKRRQIRKEQRNADQNGRNVVLQKQEAVRREEAKLVRQEEQDCQCYNRSRKQGIGDQRISPLSPGLPDAVTGDESSCWHQRSILVCETDVLGVV
jgi:hypothetical protein